MNVCHFPNRNPKFIQGSEASAHQQSSLYLNQSENWGFGYKRQKPDSPPGQQEMSEDNILLIFIFQAEKSSSLSLSHGKMEIYINTLVYTVSKKNLGYNRMIWI